jgi:cholesterol oxidase
MCNTRLISDQPARLASRLFEKGKQFVRGIAHVRQHATTDENLGAHASRGLLLNNPKSRPEACAPRIFLKEEEFFMNNYDAIVIGTGFGGTVAALRLAATGKKVLLLERGTWWFTPEKLGKDPHPERKKVPQWAKEQQPPHPVQYWTRPDHKEGLLDFFAAVRHSLNKDGLYQYSLFKQADILTASGVGGGSLIYSNVTLRPEPEVLAGIGVDLGDAEFQAATKWMLDHRGKLNKVVTKIPLPGRDVSNLGADDYLYLDRSRALRDAAHDALPKLEQQLGARLGVITKWEPLDLAVMEYDPDRGADSEANANHTFCERQGRCVLGCLPGARHTLNKTLYRKLLSKPDSGVTLSPLAEVRHIKRVVDGYEVAFRDHRDDTRKTVSAPMVFLAAGTLGTTEILLRSRDKGGLQLSDRLGTHFSTNGDFSGFAFGTSKPVYSTRGPINTCHLQVKFDGLHITVEDCAIPAMFAAISSTALGVLDNAAKCKEFSRKMNLCWATQTLPDFRDLFPHFPDTYDPTSFETEAEMVANIFFFNAMGVDDASGKFQLDNDRLDLDWEKPIADNAVFAKIETLLKTLTESMGGRYLPFPLWKGLANRKLVVVHPLGGCPMVQATAPPADQNNLNGVVDALGRVFDGSKPNGSTDVYPGLYIVDGSVIPGAVAVNPTLTIAAQAIKTVNAALP